MRPEFRKQQGCRHWLPTISKHANEKSEKVSPIHTVTNQNIQINALWNGAYSDFSPISDITHQDKTIIFRNSPTRGKKQLESRRIKRKSFHKFATVRVENWNLEFTFKGKKKKKRNRKEKILHLERQKKDQEKRVILKHTCKEEDGECQVMQR